MAFGKVKEDIARQAAEAALAKNRSVLVYRQNLAATRSGFSGAVDEVAATIEAIEATGWQLAEMAYDGKQSTNGAALMLFRRSARYPGQAARG